MKKSLRTYLLALSLITIFFIDQPVLAQVNNNDLSNINVNELSDAQVKSLMSRAQASGQTDAQLIQAAKSRGMSDDQVQSLQARITAIRSQSVQHGLADTTELSSRQYHTVSANPTNSSEANPLGSLSPEIFGAELFNGSGLSFEPNLRLATPVNYILGPDDQLDINVYGYSVDSWKLTVSPEGNINIPHVGVVNVSGKTIEQATASIKSDLAAHNYAIGKGTTVQITLGDIRSIKVIITGEVNKPGTYTLSSLSTVFNALYASGGPNENGSFRQIEIIRDNQVIRKLDVYNFLLKGDQKDNIGLKDQDIIRIPNYRVRVQLAGEVRHPALFEVLPGESLQNLINFAGGFTALAYQDKIEVTQIKADEYSIADIHQPDYRTYTPQNGDKYIVSKILKRFTNRVTIAGAVDRPGAYSLDDNPSLSKLIAGAAGLRPDAFMPEGSITRLNPDSTTTILSFNVKQIVDHSAADISLQREDLVNIFSIFDFRDNYTISIKGEVRHPGEFPYADSITLKNAIIRAGGLTDAASLTRIEISRRIPNSDPHALNGIIAKVFTVNVNNQTGLSDVNFQLKPYDIISVYSEPGYQKQQTVKIEGEVLYPGYYTLQTKNERISDLITQAGGLTLSAYADGGTLKRQYSATLGFDKSKVDTNALKQEQVSKLKRVSQSLGNDSTTVNNDQFRNDFVGIDLGKIIKSPGSKTDLLLTDGDVIRIPKQQEIVTVNGEVLIPSSVVYSSGKSFKSYVLNAGGFTEKARRRKSYILYPNGTIKGTSTFLFFNSYPVVKPGSEIYVPKKNPQNGNFSQTAISLTTALASLAVLVIGIISLHK